MNPKCKILVAYITTIIAPFYGDIFSTAAQITARAIIPSISG
jgi:hypothetical protein